jgi:hypothetical protein
MPHRARVRARETGLRQAHGLANALAESGFDVGVGERERQWVARPETEMVVSADSVASLVSQLEAVAARNGGEFDGWEASPTP